MAMRLTYLLLMTSIAAAGCSGPKQFAGMFKKSDSAVADAGRDRPSLAGRGLGQPQPPKKKSLSESISSAFKPRKKKVAGKPPVATTSASDPVSLANKPDAIDPAIFVATAHIHEAKKDFAAAKAEYRKALEIDAEHSEAVIGLAKLADSTGDISTAETHYRQAIALDSTNASLHNNLGLCLARQRKLNEAEAALSRAVQLDSDKILYRNNLATVLIDQKQPQRAFETLAKVHGPAIAHYNVGYLLHKRGANAEAVHHFGLAAQIDPSLQPAQQMLAKLAPTVPHVAERPQAPAPVRTQAAPPTTHAPPASTNAAPVVSPNDAKPSEAIFQQSSAETAPRPESKFFSTQPASQTAFPESPSDQSAALPAVPVRP